MQQLMATTMRGIVLTGFGGYDRLVWREDLPVPVPGPGDLRLTGYFALLRLMLARSAGSGIAPKLATSD